MRINNTIADAVFEVSIEREGPFYRVTVNSKPEAIVDEPLRILPTFSFSFDATKPIHAQLNGTKAHLRELLAIFSSLTPVKTSAE